MAGNTPPVPPAPASDVQANEFEKERHKRRMEFYPTIVALGTVALIGLGSLGILIWGTDTESKKVAGQVLPATLTGLLGLLGGQYLGRRTALSTRSSRPASGQQGTPPL